MEQGCFFCDIEEKIMKIKKLVVLLLALVLCLGTTSLFACDLTGHKHDYFYTCDSVQHWQECLCGNVKKGSETNHNFVKGECTGCTQTEFTSGLEFIKVTKGDDIVYRVSKYTGSDTEVIIPSNICGKVVDGIAQGGFKGCDKVTKVVLPDTITYVGDYAFEGCTSLTYNSQNGLLYLGNDWAPYIYLAKSTNKTIKSATIDSTCQVVGSGVFESHQSLSTVEIPTSVKCFAKDAFKGCVLTYVRFAGTADEWAQISFSEPSANPIFYSKKLYVGGSLLVDLVLSTPVISDYAFFDCDSLETVEFKEGVTHIGVSSFEGCNKLVKDSLEGYTYYFTSIVFPQSLVSIGHSAFRYCANINNVTIPETIEEIGTHAFANCIKLGKIIYKGTKENWNKVKIGLQWNWLAKATQLQCSNGLISLEEN